MICDTINNKIFEEEQNCMPSIDAPDGTGKTFLITIALTKIRSTEETALAVTSSGIAAQLLANGRTAHSTFKFQ
jgi:hypothetical protein